jgi:hypothetical protein
VRLRGGDIVDRAEERVEGGLLDDLQRAFAAVLNRLATPRAHVAVAMGARHMQARRLTNLPATLDVRRLGQLVDCNANTYFVKNGIPLVFTGVDVRRPGEGWAAAAELPSLQWIQAACSAQSLELDLVVPSAIALPYARPMNEISWRDGPLVLTAIYDRERHITSYRRKQWTASAPSGSPPSEPLAFDEALGATRIPLTEPLALRPKALTRNGKKVSNRALVSATLCLFVVCAAYLTLPVSIASHLINQGVPTRRDSLAARAAAWTERELATTTAALEALASFESQRVPVSLFLAHLTAALPSDIVVSDLRIDEVGGSMTLLGPRLASVPSLLAEIPELSGPELSGAITSQGMGSDRLQRATLRFMWRRPASRTGHH